MFLVVLRCGPSLQPDKKRTEKKDKKKKKKLAPADSTGNPNTRRIPSRTLDRRPKRKTRNSKYIFKKPLASRQRENQTLSSQENKLLEVPLSFQKTRIEGTPRSSQPVGILPKPTLLRGEKDKQNSLFLAVHMTQETPRSRQEV